MNGSYYPDPSALLATQRAGIQAAIDALDRAIDAIEGHASDASEREERDWWGICGTYYANRTTDIRITDIAPLMDARACCSRTLGLLNIDSSSQMERG